MDTPTDVQRSQTPALAHTKQLSAQHRGGGQTRAHRKWCALRSPATLSLAGVPATATGDGAASRAGAAAACDCCCCAAGPTARCTPLHAAVAAMAADLHRVRSTHIASWLSCWRAAWALGQVELALGDEEEQCIRGDRELGQYSGPQTTVRYATHEHGGFGRVILRAPASMALSHMVAPDNPGLNPRRVCVRRMRDAFEPTGTTDTRLRCRLDPRGGAQRDRNHRISVGAKSDAQGSPYTRRHRRHRTPTTPPAWAVRARFPPRASWLNGIHGWRHPRNVLAVLAAAWRRTQPYARNE
jgi:hypothetical protein